MIHQDKLITENIMGQIRKERDRQRMFAIQDEAWTNGELISGAVSYADLAKRQIVTRDMSPVQNLRKHPLNTGHVPSGGLDIGYNIKSPMTDRPATWQLKDDMWYPGNPRANLVRAAALIVAELERIERADLKAVAVPKRRSEPLRRIEVNTQGIWDITDPTHGGKVYAYQNAGGGITTPTYATFKVKNGAVKASAFIQ